MHFNTKEKKYKIRIVFFLFILMACKCIATNDDLVVFHHLYKSGRYLEAFEYSKRTGILEQTKTADFEYIKLLGCVADCEAELELYGNSRSHLTKALDLLNICYMADSTLLIDILFKFSKLESYQEQDSLSVNYAEQAWNVAKRLYNQKPEPYFEYCVEYMKRVGIEEVDKHVIERIKQKGNEIIQAKVFVLEADNSDTISSSIQKLENALRLFQESTYTINYTEYAELLLQLGEQYNQKGDCDYAFKCFAYAHQLFTITHGKKSRNSLVTLIDVATVVGYKGKYEIESMLMSKARDIAIEQYGENSVEYEWVITTEAEINNELFNFKDAISQAELGLQISERFSDKTDIDYLQRLLNLSSYYSNCGRLDEAKRTIQSYFDIVSANYGDNSIQYANGLTYMSQSDTLNTKDLLKEALSIYNHFEDDDCWFEKADVYYCLSCTKGVDVDSAYIYADMALKIYGGRLGEQHSKYISALGEKAEIDFRTGNYSQALEEYSLYLSLRREDVFDRFVGLSKKRRKDYWDGYVYPFYEQIPLVSFMLQNDPSARELLYNTLLFRKGLLLNAEKSIDDNLQMKLCIPIISDSVIEFGTLFEGTKNILEPSSSISDMQIENNELEDPIKIVYSDVRRSLTEQEMAIEFTKIPTAKDSIWYCALVAKAKYESPMLVPLFKESQLKCVNAKTHLGTKQLYELVWLPLKEYLKDITTIYFSPDGELHFLPIEYAFTEGNEYMIDIYKMIRLSSTRELAHVQSKNCLHQKAVLFGGLNYNADANIIEESNRVNKVYNSCIYINKERAAFDSRVIVEELPFAKEEVRDIVNLFPKESNCTLYEGNLGTEEVFKSLSGKSTNIIHLSTHGYCWSKNMEIVHTRHLNSVCEEDSVLTRSGLYMSGANKMLMSENWPQTLEDGIITAYEISQLRFYDLDLAVLSACQTGLGDLKGDGVFGLQRGFKIAGAQTLLMSLWGVNDYSTRLLMHEFYRNYITGASKYESLRLAQKYIREYKDDNGNLLFDNPYYWAGFVLLDATD